MAYNQKTWKDNKSGKTPIKAADLNRMEQGIADASTVNDYSSEEQIIGTYYDQTLYRKQITVTSLPANQLKQVAHNISNLKDIVAVRGNIRLNYDNLSAPEKCRKVPLYWLKTNFDIDFSISETTLNFNSTHSTVVEVSVILILEYTKTTNSVSTTSDVNVTDSPTI